MDKKKAVSGGTPVKEFARHCVLAVICATVLTLLLLAGMAILRSRIDLPSSVDQPVTTIMISVCTLFATYIAGRRRGKTGLLLGVASGLSVFGLMALVSAIMIGGEISGQIFTKATAIVCAGGLGGLIGVSRAGRRRASKKKIKN